MGQHFDIYTNTRRRRLRPRGPGTSGAPALGFHERLPGYRPTGLVDLPALAAALGLRSLSVKDESNRLGLPSYKVLGASWATYRALTDRLGHRGGDIGQLKASLARAAPLRLAAATDGNHGRAVARVASWLGLPATIFVPQGTTAARIAGIRAEGAVVEVVEGTYEDALHASRLALTDDVVVVSDTSWPGYDQVPRWVVDGYRTVFHEVDRQHPARPDVVFVQMGVGALTASVVEHYGDGADVVAVEPLTAACGLRSARAGRPVTVPGPHRSVMAGLNCGAASPLTWPVVQAGVHTFVAIADEAAEQAVRVLAGAGIVAGETGAAGLAGLLALTAAPSAHRVPLAGRHVLVLCTEGATDPESYRRIVGPDGP
jgi:diaminopropionate ammonia-lyase